MGRGMTTEERLALLERRTRAQRWLVVISWLMGTFAALTAAQDHDQHAVASFDSLRAKMIVVGEPGKPGVVTLGSHPNGDGMVITSNAAGKELVRLGSTKGGDGAVKISDKDGKPILGTSTSEDTGEGMLVSFNRAGKPSAVWP